MLQYFKVLFFPWNSFLRFPRALFQNVKWVTLGETKIAKVLHHKFKHHPSKCANPICTNEQEKRQERSSVSRKVWDLKPTSPLKQVPSMARGWDCEGMPSFTMPLRKTNSQWATQCLLMSTQGWHLSVSYNFAPHPMCPSPHRQSLG